MTKFSLETKEKLISLIEKDNYTFLDASNKLNISLAVAKRWYQMYEIHGYEGLTLKSKTYSGDFKIHVVKYMHNYNLSLNEASAMFGIPSRSTLTNWERIYYEKGEGGFSSENRGRPPKNNMKYDEVDNKIESTDKNETNNLITEVQKLRAEVAYLKKSIALKEEKRNLKIRKKRL